MMTSGSQTVLMQTLVVTKLRTSILNVAHEAMSSKLKILCIVLVNKNIGSEKCQRVKQEMKRMPEKDDSYKTENEKIQKPFV